MHIWKPILALCIAGSLFAADPWAGTWKLKTSPESRLASRTITERETGPRTFHVAFTDVTKTGQKTESQEALVCDGKEHAAEAPSFIQICELTAATTRTLIGKKDGKIVLQVTHAISADGKTMTVTDTASHKSTIYEKQ